MKITQSQLHQIILEEYIKEENLTEADQEEIEKLLKQIQGDKYRSPEERDPKRFKTNDGETAAMDAPHKSMTPDTGVQDVDVQSQIAQLVGGMDPDDVAALFQSVFSGLPGVEMQDDGPGPPSLYGDPADDGRSPITLGPVREGFELSTLKTMIREALKNV